MTATERHYIFRLTKTLEGRNRYSAENKVYCRYEARALIKAIRNLRNGTTAAQNERMRKRAIALSRGDFAALKYL